MSNHQSAGSLRVRMLLSAALVLAVFLGVVGLVLDNAYRQSAEQSVSERLQLHIYALIAASNEEIGEPLTLFLPDELQEPQFNQLGSGLYGMVFNSGGEEIWRSQSAADLVLETEELRALLFVAAPGQAIFRRFDAGESHEPLFYLTYPIIWQSEAGESRFVYAALEELGPYSKSVSTYRNNLWGWLIAGMVGLVVVQVAILSWGLKPISGLESDLKAIEQGEQGYLEGQYPREIAGVTQSLNMLLSQERKQRERYRTTMADLAHSLKTPLAILTAETSREDRTPEELGGLLQEQVGRMSDIISYQLERAVSHTSTLVKSRVDIQPVAEKLTSALGQVYRDKQPEFKLALNGAIFPGDERDLMEMLGNLLDNACKYGEGQVGLVASVADNQLFLEVEDNGSGIGDDDWDRVLQRGERLDTQEAGQGIGLAVVAEIVERYNGEFSVVGSSLGGACLRITIPL